MKKPRDFTDNFVTTIEATYLGYDGYSWTCLFIVTFQDTPMVMESSPQIHKDANPYNYMTRIIMRIVYGMHTLVTPYGSYVDFL